MTKNYYYTTEKPYRELKSLEYSHRSCMELLGYTKMTLCYPIDVPVSHYKGLNILIHLNFLTPKTLTICINGILIDISAMCLAFHSYFKSCLEGYSVICLGYTGQDNLRSMSHFVKIKRRKAHARILWYNVGGITLAWGHMENPLAVVV